MQRSWEKIKEVKRSKQSSVKFILSRHCSYRPEGGRAELGGVGGNCGVTVTNTHNLFTNVSTYICIW